ncbi:MAG: triose-phosphate isomerase [Christensenellales bacterium]
MLYIGNFKMNIPTDEYISNLVKVDNKGNKLAIALPFPYLFKYKSALCDAGISLGAQNVTGSTVKESTGEVSGDMLIDVGCDFVIVGHSERRRFKMETTAKIREKCEQALKSNLKVVLCVGESREDYENGNTSKVLEKQLKEILNSLKGITYDNFIIAYEPVWAIGTGLIPSIDEIEIVVRHIKSMTEKWAKSELRVLYGGSCKPNNAKMLKCVQGIDGFLIGGAFLNTNDLQGIIDA